MSGGTTGKQPDKKAAPKTEKAGETVKLIIAHSRSLVGAFADNLVLQKLLEDSDLRIANGKKVEVTFVGVSAHEMIEGVLNGTLKADVIVPASQVFLELGDRESKLKTGKPLVSEQVTVMKQPQVFAVRRAMAEAMGWPKKELGWSDVVEIANKGWGAVGQPQWGPLKLVIGNPNTSDAGLHAAVSACLALSGKSKSMTKEDTATPQVKDAIKALDGAVVWYPPYIEEFVRNEAQGVPPECQMVFLAEHHLLTLNERTIRRKAAPDWIAIYPPKGMIVDDIAAAMINREWVNDEKREAASVAFKLFRSDKIQKRLVELGHRPGVAGIGLGPNLTEAAGVDPKQPRSSLEIPSTDVVLDSVQAWIDAWKSRQDRMASISNPATTTTAAPASSAKLTSLSPTVQCVRIVKPSAVAIRDKTTKKVKGSGVIVDARGYAVTNYHVVGTEKQVAVSILTDDSKIYMADVIWAEPNQDLAIVKILNAGKFPPVKLGDPKDREVGITVLAFGNPLGYTGTVTVGIISAMNREITLPTGVILKDVLQTDAGINPGNSGGPLVDIDGNLVGIVFALRDGAQSIAFVIPIERVIDAMRKNSLQ